MWHLLALHQRRSSNHHKIQTRMAPNNLKKKQVSDLASINSHNSHNTPCVVRGSQPKVSLPHRFVNPVVTDSCGLYGLYGHHLRCEMHNSPDVWSIKNWDRISSSLLKPSWVHRFFALMFFHRSGTHGLKDWVPSCFHKVVDPHPYLLITRLQQLNSAKMASWKKTQGGDLLIWGEIYRYIH